MLMLVSMNIIMTSASRYYEFLVDWFVKVTLFMHDFSINSSSIIIKSGADV